MIEFMRGIRTPLSTTVIPEPARTWSKQGRVFAVPIPDQVLQPCGCRESCPRWSSGMVVFVEESAEPIVSVDAQTRERRRIGERFG
jgi:hypothetical protein